MAAVAAEPGAAAVQTTTTTAAKDDGSTPESNSASTGFSEASSGTEVRLDAAPVAEQEDRGDGQGRHVRPELKPAATEDQRSILPAELNTMDRFTPGEPEGAGAEDLRSILPADRSTMDWFAPGDPEGGGNVSAQEAYRSIPPDPQPSAVFLHSFPVPPPVTEAGLSLAEPAEPTTNVTTDPDRGYTARVQAKQLPAQEAVTEDTADKVYGKNSGGTEEPQSPPCKSPKRRMVAEAAGKESSSGPETMLAPLQDLSPGSEVRVSLDHVIDDALVVSFRFGDRVFSGVLMDVSNRFGPYGIPITVFPRRDDQPKSAMPLQPVTNNDPTTKQEEVTNSALPSHHSWTSKPPPLFQEGAPYPPPLFIRDTYNQALPQPLPRKIKRPKRRYRCEEPTSIMNAIKLRPRQVLCDKCKGVVVSSGHREARRGPVDLRGEEASRRRRQAEGPISSEVKRLRSDDKGGRASADRRSSTGLQVSSTSSASSSRVLRGGTSSLPESSSRIKLNSKKAPTKASAVDCSKARQVLKKLARSSQPSLRRPKDSNQSQKQSQIQDHPKAVTRAAALQNHNQKVHFTRRLQHLSSTAVSSASHTTLPPRMRLKPQSATLKSC